MSKWLLLLVVFITFSISSYAKSFLEVVAQDTNDVIKMNDRAFKSRNTAPKFTISEAKKALSIANQLQYQRGVGEAYRVIGIGYYYNNASEKAIDNYLKALAIFQQINDLQSEAKVYNNIGVLYRDNDYGQSSVYLDRALAIAKSLNDNTLMASLYLNKGTLSYRQKSYHEAVDYYTQSIKLFGQLKDSSNLVKCEHNLGVVYFWLNQLDLAEKLLLHANVEAKKRDMNETVASINLTLASLYIAEDNFAEAERIVQEGKLYANIIDDDKLIYDYQYTTYQLEFKRKNYDKALFYLQNIYKQDSIMHKSTESTKINLIQKKFEQAALQKDSDRLKEKQEYDRIRFFAVVTVAGLLLVVIALLIGNVKRKTKTNGQLTELNAEVSRQKDNLDRINHHLEEIIDERTRDLQIKNRKLSEYSSYLSHQIRGPIATLKGLMNLEKEGLVDKGECIEMMDKCVSDIDSKIIEMSDMLHNPAKTGA